jgi:mannose-6-phosphate isomerase-like protein (cupin superfamily)
MSVSSSPAEISLLSGRVLKRSLPALLPPTAADAPALKRLMLPQGELAQIHDSAGPIHYLAYIELRDGTERGNHYHLAKDEFVYLIQGELQLAVEDIESKVRESVLLQEGDLVFISSRVAHALHILKSGHAIEFSGTRFDAADTHRYPLT